MTQALRGSTGLGIATLVASLVVGLLVAPSSVPAEFYAVAAQVNPVFVVALALEQNIFESFRTEADHIQERLRAREADLRAARPFRRLVRSQSRLAARMYPTAVRTEVETALEHRPVLVVSDVVGEAARVARDLSQLLRDLQQMERRGDLDEESKKIRRRLLAQIYGSTESQLRLRTFAWIIILREATTVTANSRSETTRDEVLQAIQEQEDEQLVRDDHATWDLVLDQMERDYLERTADRASADYRAERPARRLTNVFMLGVLFAGQMLALSGVVAEGSDSSLLFASTLAALLAAFVTVTAGAIGTLVKHEHVETVPWGPIDTEKR